jgi:outer membrane protein
MLRTPLVLTLFASLSVPALANENGWSLGIGLAAGQRTYRDQNTKVMPVPLVRYQGERFFVEGTALGMKLYETPQWGADLIAQVDFQSFDPDDAEQASFRALNERKPSALAGLRFNYNLSRQDSLGLSLLSDTGSQRRALIPTVSWKHGFAASGPQTQFFSSMELRYNPAKYNRYYYGISAEESARSGLSAYSPGSTPQLEVGLGINHRFDSGWSMTAIAGVKSISSKLKDSPMVERTEALGGVLGLSYRFN